jgi:hypothetical protein
MKTLKLHGFCSPSDDSFTFIHPIFTDDEGGYYVQKVNQSSKVDSFERITFNGPVLLVTKVEYLSVGDNAIFAVSEDGDGCYYNNYLNTRTYLKGRIRHYIHRPFFYRQVSEFISYGLPEFHGQLSEKDYLSRVILSNIVPEFVKKFGVEIKSINLTSEKTGLRVRNKNLTDMFLRNQKTVKKILFINSSESMAYSDVYLSFIDYASQKNEGLKKVDVFNNSRYIAENLLFRSKAFDRVGHDYSEIKDSLVFIINSLANNDDYSGEIEWKNYSSKKYFNQIFSTCKVIDELKAERDVSLKAISLILYLTSRLIDEVKK